MTNFIAVAVEPLREAAMDRAAQKAKEILLDISFKLTNASGDRDAFAPFPSSTNESSKSWSEKKAYYDLVRRCTKCNWPSASKSSKEPDLGKMDFDVSFAFVEAARKDASFQYDAFIAKLTEKAGEGVVSAELIGNHVWGYSILKVTKDTGLVDLWKTQMIINVSKLGNVFNQFPTRKVKK
jgi:hypothetical protein